MGKHLTADERATIQISLVERKSVNEIAKEVGKSRTTISREIQKHIITKRTALYGRSFNECVHGTSCRLVGLCEDKPNCATKNCRMCKECNTLCTKFEKQDCEKLLIAP